MDLGKWTRPGICDSGACVEVKLDLHSVLVRASSDPEEVVQFTHEEWETFLAGVTNGDFDL